MRGSPTPPFAAAAEAAALQLFFAAGVPLSAARELCYEDHALRSAEATFDAFSGNSLSWLPLLPPPPPPQPQLILLYPQGACGDRLCVSLCWAPPPPQPLVVCEAVEVHCGSRVLQVEVAEAAGGGGAPGVAAALRTVAVRLYSSVLLLGVGVHGGALHVCCLNRLPLPPGHRPVHVNWEGGDCGETAEPALLAASQVGDVHRWAVARAAWARPALDGHKGGLQAGAAPTGGFFWDVNAAAQRPHAGAAVAAAAAASMHVLLRCPTLPDASASLADWHWTAPAPPGGRPAGALPAASRAAWLACSAGLWLLPLDGAPRGVIAVECLRARSVAAPPAWVEAHGGAHEGPAAKGSELFAAASLREALRAGCGGGAPEGRISSLADRLLFLVTRSSLLLVDGAYPAAPVLDVAHPFPLHPPSLLAARVLSDGGEGALHLRVFISSAVDAQTAALSVAVAGGGVAQGAAAAPPPPPPPQQQPAAAGAESAEDILRALAGAPLPPHLGALLPLLPRGAPARPPLALQLVAQPVLLGEPPAQKPAHAPLAGALLLPPGADGAGAGGALLLLAARGLRGVALSPGLRKGGLRFCVLPGPAGDLLPVALRARAGAPGGDCDGVPAGGSTAVPLPAAPPPAPRPLPPPPPPPFPALAPARAKGLAAALATVAQRAARLAPRALALLRTQGADGALGGEAGPALAAEGGDGGYVDVVPRRAWATLAALTVAGVPLKKARGKGGGHAVAGEEEGGGGEEKVEQAPRQLIAAVLGDALGMQADLESTPTFPSAQQVQGAPSARVRALLRAAAEPRDGDASQPQLCAGGGTLLSALQPPCTLRELSRRLRRGPSAPPSLRVLAGALRSSGAAEALRLAPPPAPKQRAPPLQPPRACRCHELPTVSPCGSAACLFPHLVVLCGSEGCGVPHNAGLRGGDAGAAPPLPLPPPPPPPRAPAFLVGVVGPAAFRRSEKRRATPAGGADSAAAEGAPPGGEEVDFLGGFPGAGEEDGGEAAGAPLTAEAAAAAGGSGMRWAPGPQLPDAAPFLGALHGADVLPLAAGDVLHGILPQWGALAHLDRALLRALAPRPTQTEAQQMAAAVATATELAGAAAAAQQPLIVSHPMGVVTETLLAQLNAEWDAACEEAGGAGGVEV